MHHVKKEMEKLIRHAELLGLSTNRGQDAVLRLGFLLYAFPEYADKGICATWETMEKKIRYQPNGLANNYNPDPSPTRFDLFDLD